MCQCQIAHEHMHKCINLVVHMLCPHSSLSVGCECICCVLTARWQWVVSSYVVSSQLTGSGLWVHMLCPHSSMAVGCECICCVLTAIAVRPAAACELNHGSKWMNPSPQSRPKNTRKKQVEKLLRIYSMYSRAVGDGGGSGRRWAKWERWVKWGRGEGCAIKHRN